VYTSPYTAQITPGSTYSSSSATDPVICDDFSDESYVPEDWNTNVTTLSSLESETLPNQSVYYGRSGGANAVAVSGPGVTTAALSQAQAYEVAAILAIGIDFGSAAGSTAQQDYSYALWQLFDPAGSNGSGVNPGAIGWLQSYTGSYTDYVTSGQTQSLSAAEVAAAADLNNAVLDVTGNNGSAASAIVSKYNVTIYSYSSNLGVPTGGCGGTCPQPQEFIAVGMAEPPPLAVFAVYFLFGGGGLLFFGRRRIFRADS
jgi:hypothetical protein